MCEMTIITVKYMAKIQSFLIDNVRNDDRDSAISNAINQEKELLININCPIRIIIDYIRKVTQLEETDEFDLCDELTCQMRNIFSFAPYTSSLEVLQPKLKYLIIKYERDDNGQVVNYVSVLPGKVNKVISDTGIKMRKQFRKGSSKLLQDKGKVS